MEVRVSDHAIVRYLERHYKMDIQAIRDEILTPTTKAAIAAGSHKFKRNNMDS
jgi:hypothetical protein